MKTKTKRILTAACVFALLGVLLGATQGTQTDPLVTMSYLSDVAGPAILKDVDAKLAAREQSYVDKLDALVRQYEQEMDDKLAGATGTGDFSSAAFTVVTVKSGQTLTGSTGCEFLLRSGTATCVAASAPGLIDSTDGSTLASGGAVQPNHLYLSTADGRGLKATADATVLVRGTYSIA